MILVTGAAGSNGSEVMRVLCSRGVGVRAMFHTHIPTFPPGVETARADYNDSGSLAKALEGIDHAFLVSPPSERALEWQMNFVAAAKLAGVKHIVKLSMLGADPASSSRFQRSHGEIEKALEGSGIGWTHLRPNFFMQTLAQYVQGDAFYAIGGEISISVVDRRDVALVAAAVLTEPGHQGKVYEITGPQALTSSEARTILSQALGRELNLVPLSFEQSQEVMLSAGFPVWNAQGVVELNRWFHTGAAAGVTDVVRTLAKNDPRTFAQFAKDGPP